MLFHPHESFFNKDFEEKGKKIAQKMNVKDHFDDKKCAQCHTTLVDSKYPKVPDEEKGLFGIICETCHNPAEDWVELHDKKGKVEEAVKNGMRNTRNLYAWAKDCFACHRGAKEEYFKAGHRPGDKFDLIKYSQGDFKHWVWSKKEKEEGNLDAKLMEKLGKIWITGEVFQAQTSAMRISEASGSGEFTSKNHAMLVAALKNLEVVEKSIPSDNLRKIIDAGKKVTPDPATAKAVVEEIKKLANSYVGDLDKSPIGAGKISAFPIPGENEYIRKKK
ncbi:MAG: hypothetical protein HY579_13300 [Nitrospinae bacterium]|nr:hypothetical protein [Nitrospinota bacterium]